MPWTTTSPDPRPRAVRDGSTIKTLRQALRVFASRPGPRLIAGIAATTWGARAVLGPPGPADLVAAGAAIAVWPVQEWLLHKHLLHLEPRTIGGRRFDPLFARRHRAHHSEPRDVDGTLLPLPVILGALPIAAGGWLCLFGPRRAALTAMATYSTMALFYEWTHFIVHTSVQPKTAYGKKVRRNHRLHHYRHERFWFGFTFPLVDRWFGTDPDPAGVARSPTAMDLHGLASVNGATEQTA
jgi:sterol desaturase/sphingolipid hydroxylase (fatty acid hydroxylase superfamily)